MATPQTSPGFGRPVERNRSGFLKMALRLDAVATAAVGVVMILAAVVVIGEGRPFVTLLGMPTALLVSVGLFLVMYAAFVWIAGSRRSSVSGAWAAVVVNAVYAAGCIVVVATDVFSLTALGVAFVLVQAAAVALFAILQFIALRRSQPATR